MLWKIVEPWGTNSTTAGTVTLDPSDIYDTISEDRAILAPYTSRNRNWTDLPWFLPNTDQLSDEEKLEQVWYVGSRMQLHHILGDSERASWIKNLN